MALILAVLFKVIKETESMAGESMISGPWITRLVGLS
jgi:hypothetical protein